MSGADKELRMRPGKSSGHHPPPDTGRTTMCQEDIDPKATSSESIIVQHIQDATHVVNSTNDEQTVRRQASFAV